MNKIVILTPLKIIPLVILLIITATGCGSSNEYDPEPTVPEEINEMDTEEKVDKHEPEPEPNAEKEKQVVVNVDVLRLRGGPSTDYEIIDRLVLGTILKVFEEQGEWLQVKAPHSQEGWVHGDYVIKPADSENIYEVLSVEIQPVGYSEAQIINFVEESTSFNLIGFVLPEFDHPNDISNDDLIRAITLSGLPPSYIDEYNWSNISGADVQETAISVFGTDMKEIEHNSVFPYYWISDKQIYRVEAFGPESHTETKVLTVTETETEIIVDAVHLIYYYSPQLEEYVSYVAGELSKMSDFGDPDDFYENAIVLIDEQHTDGTIEQYLDLFPVRRYILSKEGDGICYIRKSYLLEEQ